MGTTSGITSSGHRPALAELPTDRRTERVVLATDGGPAGLSAMRWVADRARTHTLDVTVLDVVEVPDLPGWEAGERYSTADRAVRRVADHLAWAAASVNCTGTVVAGDPRTRIVAATEGADLLVVGTNRVGASRHLVASFSTKVAEAAECPTVVVPCGWERSAGPVIVGVEGDGSDSAAVDFAAHEAAVLRRDLVVVHAWHLTGMVAPAFAAASDRRAVETAASGRLSRVVDDARTRHPHLRFAPLLAHDEPVSALVRAGEGASLVVVGSHSLSMIDRALFTSVSRGVLERPACPVAIVRPRIPAV